MCFHIKKVNHRKICCQNCSCIDIFIIPKFKSLVIEFTVLGGTGNIWFGTVVFVEVKHNDVLLCLNIFSICTTLFILTVFSHFKELLKNLGLVKLTKKLPVKFGLSKVVKMKYKF